MNKFQLKQTLKRVLNGAIFLVLVQSIGLPLQMQGELPIEFSSKAFAKPNSTTPKKNITYFRPPGRLRPQQTAGASSRGCPMGTFGSVSLLAPNDHVGLTSSARPTFSWYVAAVPSTPMQFTLVEPGVSKPVFLKKLNVDKPGIVQLQIPENVPGLSVGKKYRWTVSLVCNAKRPSQNIYVRSWIERETLAKDANFSSLKNINEQAAFYAESGFWYDAVATISKAYLTNPQDTSSIINFRDLLNQVGLSKIASSELRTPVE
jgi:Domain of Unknown Function (DUF928)